MDSLSSSPVLALEHNLTWAFENAIPYAGKRLADAVAAGLVDPEIGLNCDSSTAPPQAPYLRKESDAATPQMHVSLKHLEMLWAFIYGWMVIYEHGIQKPLIARTYTGILDLSDPLLRRAVELRDWSASLREKCSAWPTDLPSPIHYGSDSERYYGEKANLVFQQAVAFLLGHEHAHAAAKHLDYLAEGVTDIEAAEAEKEADVAAFESVVEHGEDDAHKLSKAWSILSAMSRSLVARNASPAPSIVKVAAVPPIRTYWSA